MRISIIYLIGLIILLSGCSLPKHQITTLNTNVNSTTITGSQSGNIIHIPIAATATVEVYFDSKEFRLFKDIEGCVIDTGGMVEAQRVYCTSLAGYNHIYKIPFLNIEYYYQSQMMINYISGSYERFLREDGGFDPMIVSGAMLSWVGNNSYIYKQTKSIGDSPQEILDSIKLGSGCKFDSVPSGVILSGYQIFTVPGYAYLGPETLPSEINRCLVNLPDVQGGESWAYIFSSDPKDYYYIILLNGGGMAPPIYGDQSLKLFVE